VSDLTDQQGWITGSTQRTNNRTIKQHCDLSQFTLACSHVER